MIFTNTENKRHCFIHIPRTAGTHVEQEICRAYHIPHNAGRIDLLLGVRQLISPGNWFALQHLTYKETQLFIQKEIIEKCNIYFSIVRNPYDRFVSLFKYWSKGKKESDLNNFIDKVENLEIASYQHSGLFSKKDKFEALRLEECKYHLLPQSLYLCDDSGIINLEIFKYKEIEEIQKYSAISLGLRFDGFSAGKRRSANLILLSDIQKERIYSLYKEDFEKFDYDEFFSKESDY